MNSIDRFSLLLLEPGEIYFCDHAVTYRLPVKDRPSQEGWERSWFEDELRGRLKICSKSIVFDPRVKPLPLIKFPLKFCSIIKDGKESSGHNSSAGNGQAEILEIVSSVTVEMLENNVMKPYKFRRKEYTHLFELNVTKATEALHLILQLQRASSLPPNDHNFMIQAILRSLQSRTYFNYSLLKDPEEVRVLELQANKVSPLVTNPGRILITNTTLYFQPFNNLEKELILRIPFPNVKQVIKRRYLLRHVGIEIFYKERFLSRYLYLVFKEPQERDNAYKCLMLQENLNVEPMSLENITYKWQMGVMSNFDYLSYLNSEADRSVNDLTQYPVFPWVIADYSSENLDLSDEGSYRDLTKPIGALNEERLHSLQQRCVEMPEPKFLYGSHYSTPGFVLFYLVRQHPLFMLCLQNGKFDHPDRMFNNVADTWRNVTINSSDFKELVPEFYDSKGEFLTNGKAIAFGTRQNGEPVWDVILPPWAKSPVDFVSKLREALESDYVSFHINHWIDLIFGYKQKGKDAQLANNVFYHLCYEGAVDLGAITDLHEKMSFEVQIMEFGQIPKQIFHSPHVCKSQFLSPYNNNTLIEQIKNNIGSFSNDSSLYKVPDESTFPKHLKLFASISRLVEKKEIRLHSKPITWLMIVPNGRVLVSLAKDGFLKAYDFPTLEKVGNFDSGSLAFSSCVHIPGTTEVLIASWDNYLYRFNYKLCQKKDSLQAHSDGITCLDMNSSFLVTGSWDSLVRVWDMSKIALGSMASGWSSWRLQMDHLVCQMDHDGPVHCVEIHPSQQLFASATKYGFVNVWHLTKDFCLLNKKCHDGEVTGLVWSPDGETVATCGVDGKLILINSTSGSTIASKNFDQELHCLKWDGRIAIIGGASGFVYFFDLAKSEIIRQIEAHEGSVTALCVAPGGLNIVTGGDDRKVKLWGLILDNQSDREVETQKEYS